MEELPKPTLDTWDIELDPVNEFIISIIDISNEEALVINGNDMDTPQGCVEPKITG
jgi:hypothetical protein